MPLGHAIDATRVARLKREGYIVVCETIPSDITPENRVILAWPSDWGPVHHGDSVNKDRHHADGSGREPRLLPEDMTIWPRLMLPESPWKRFAVHK